MTIALSANTPRVSYTVNEGASQTSFTVPFVFFTASTDLNVFVDGTERTFDASTANTSQYTVSGGSGSTGSITTSVTGATGGSTVVITRDIPLSRTTDFPSSGAFEVAKLNTELDTVTAIQSDFNDFVDRTIRLQEFDSAVSMELPLLASRKGTVLGFNASTGAVEAGPTITAVQSLSAVTTSINLLGTSAVVEDMGLLATSAVIEDMGLLGTSSNVTAMGLLGTSAVIADMALLGTSAVVADMALLATTDVIADMNTLATSDIIADLNTLATSDIVTDMNLLATSANVTAMGLLGTSANVTAMGLLGTSAVLTDMGLLGTAAVVEDMGLLATTAVIEDMGLLATSAVIEDMGLLATSAVIEDMGLLGTSANVTNMATLGASGVVANIATVAGANSNISTVASNISGVNSFADRYRIGSSDPSSSNDEGDLFYNTSDNTFKFFNGSSFVAVNVSGIDNLVEDTTPQLGGNLDVNGKNINFGDSSSAGSDDTLQFGASQDLKIYHNGSDSYITDTGTGGLNVQASSFNLRNAAGTETGLQFIEDGAVTLYHNNVARIASASTGADITGTLDITGAFSATAGSTITVADNAAALTLVSTDADASTGPIFKLYRNSASPADSDRIGEIHFDGEDSAGNQLTYVQIFANVNDVTDGTEDSTLIFQTVVAGTLENRIGITASEVHINDGSKNLDFRVESDGNANMLFVNGNTNKVGIGTNDPHQMLGIESDSNPAISIVDTTNNVEALIYADNDTVHMGSLTNHNLVLRQNNAERMQINTSGVISSVAGHSIIPEFIGNLFLAGNTTDAAELQSCFSTTYSVYRLIGIVGGSHSAEANVKFRFLTGTDTQETTGWFGAGRSVDDSQTLVTSAEANGNSCTIVQNQSSTGFSIVDMHIYMQASATQIIGMAGYHDQSSDRGIFYFGYKNDQAAAKTGFRLFNNQSNNMSAINWSVYGIRIRQNATTKMNGSYS